MTEKEDVTCINGCEFSKSDFLKKLRRKDSELDEALNKVGRKGSPIKYDDSTGRYSCLAKDVVEKRSIERGLDGVPIPECHKVHVLNMLEQIADESQVRSTRRARLYCTRCYAVASQSDLAPEQMITNNEVYEAKTNCIIYLERFRHVLSEHIRGVPRVFITEDIIESLHEMVAAVGQSIAECMNCDYSAPNVVEVMDDFQISLGD